MPLLFRSFEDLGILDDPGLQALLRAIEREPLVLALKGASQRLRERVYANLSDRVATAVRAAVQQSEPAHYREIDAAHVVMMTKAKQLVDLGLIALPNDGNA